jgi:hypothetical protein
MAFYRANFRKSPHDDKNKYWTKAIKTAASMKKFHIAEQKVISNDCWRIKISFQTKKAAVICTNISG